MIAKPEQHLNRQTMLRLLDDALKPEHSEQATQHLQTCASCQYQLERHGG